MTSVRNTARSEASEEVTEGESNVRVDDNKYLPRLMHSFYGEDYPVEHGDVWAPFEKRLSDARLALLSSAGLHLRSQQPFDLERERREPTWGDSSYRMLPNTVQRDDLAVAHLHLNSEPLLADPNITLPLAALAELVDEARVGGAVDEHVSVMGYQGWHDDALDRWRDETGPAVVRELQAQGADGVILAPA
jgi:D-proline reductase (dithiol) PrdB